MAESYRALRTSLLLSSLGAPPKVISGYKRLAAGKARRPPAEYWIVLAQKGSRVLLVDAICADQHSQSTGHGHALDEQCSDWKRAASSGDCALHSDPNALHHDRRKSSAEPAELWLPTNMRDVLNETAGTIRHIVDRYTTHPVCDRCGAALTC